jgi:hypothetical protein
MKATIQMRTRIEGMVGRFDSGEALGRSENAHGSIMVRKANEANRSCSATRDSQR